MPSWVDQLIHEYTQGSQDLSKMKKGVNPEVLADDKELKLIDSMIRSMSEVIQMMETGRNPKVMKGIHVDSIYHVQSYSNVDLIPDIEEQLREENAINKKHLFMTPEEKMTLVDILAYSCIVILT